MDVVLTRFNNNLFTQNNTQTFDSLQGALLRVSVHEGFKKRNSGLKKLNNAT